MPFFARTVITAMMVTASVAAIAAEPEFSADRVKAHVAFLADDLLEGRGTGARGHEIAMRYVASQFAAYGLTPGAKDGSWFQPVILSEARAGSVPASVTITAGKAAPLRFAQASEIIVGSSQTDATTDVAAPVVFAGFGLDAPEQGFNDYAGIDVRGKIVVIFAGIPKGPPNEVLAHLSRQKSVMAAARGAIGIITIPTLESNRLRPWDRQKQNYGTPSMTWVKPDGSPYVAAPAMRASAMFSMVAAEALFSGSRQPLATLLAAADRSAAALKGFALPAQVRITSTSLQRKVETANVVAKIEGSDPVLKAEYVGIMGHLDHLGSNPDKAGDKIYNGALDNAAGVAVMLEVAHGFAHDAVKPKRSLIFVANTAEEKGLLGAESFANDPPVPIADIVSVVDLDQPLLLYDFTDVIAFGGDHSSMGEAIARAAAKAGVAVSPDPMPAETIFVRSDHYTFVKRGVPALLLATGFANGGKDAWEHYLATDYHQPSDDMKLPINWKAGARYAQVNYLIAREIADAATRPRWYEGDYFGATFAPAATKIARPTVKGK